MKKLFKKRILPLVATLVILIGVLVQPLSALSYDFSTSPYTNLIVWSYAPDTIINDVENMMDFMELLPNGTWRYHSNRQYNKSFGDQLLAEFQIPAGDYYVKSNARDFVTCYMTVDDSKIFDFDTSWREFSTLQTSTVRIYIKSGLKQAADNVVLDFMVGVNDGSAWIPDIPYSVPLFWAMDQSVNVVQPEYSKGSIFTTVSLTPYLSDNAAWGLIRHFSDEEVRSMCSFAIAQDYFDFLEPGLEYAFGDPSNIFVAESNGSYVSPPSDYDFSSFDGAHLMISLDPSCWSLSTPENECDLSFDVYGLVFSSLEGFSALEQLPSLTPGRSYYLEDTLFTAKAALSYDSALPPESLVFTGVDGREYCVFYDAPGWGICALDGQAVTLDSFDIYEATLDDGSSSGSPGITPGFTQEDIEESYQSGYDSGYDMGYGSGWADGTAHVNQQYQDKFSGISTGIFEKCFISAVLYSSQSTGGGASTAISFPHAEFNVMSGGVYFNALWSQLNDFLLGSDPDWSYVDYVDIEFTWAGDSVFDFNTFPIYISGSSLVESAEITTVDGHVYNVSADGNSTDFRKFAIVSDVMSYPVLVKKFVLRVGRPNDLLHEFTLFSNTEMFQEGYVSGYVSGLNSSSAEVYDEGFNLGFSDGYLVGKKEGIQLSETGDWRSLLTAVVEAPINTFQSLFNFEILGLDMRLAFGSILALCVLLIVVKKALL